jgi:hypothetical protein
MSERECITMDRLKEYLEYDPVTGIFIWLKTTGKRTHLIGKQAGSIRPKGHGKNYWGIRIDTVMYSAARLAWFYMTGVWPIDCIDHINGDSLDNRFSNIREATHTENQRNITVRSKKSELPMGVSHWRKRYEARIWIDKNRVKLGIYDTFKEASERYIQARREYFGEYNRL